MTDLRASLASGLRETFATAHQAGKLAMVELEFRLGKFFVKTADWSEKTPTMEPLDIPGIRTDVELSAQGYSAFRNENTEAGYKRAHTTLSQMPGAAMYPPVTLFDQHYQSGFRESRIVPPGVQVVTQDILPRLKVQDTMVKTRLRRVDVFCPRSDRSYRLDVSLEDTGVKFTSETRPELIRLKTRSSVTMPGGRWRADFTVISFENETRKLDYQLELEFVPRLATMPTDAEIRALVDEAMDALNTVQQAISGTDLV